MIGWIKLHRKMLDWGWYKDPAVKIVWLHLLLTVNREDSEFKGHKVPVGAGVFGRKELAGASGLTEKQVRRALEVLEKGQQIGIQRTNKFSIITITKWADYQEQGQQQGQQRANRGPTKGQQRATDKEVKKIRKGEEENSFGASAPAKKGSRLPDDWTPSEKNIQDAQAQNLTTDEVRHEADKFRDYWISASGRNATKRDWDATWRNWCRNASERKPAGNRRQVGYRTNGDKFADAVAELRGEIAAAENGQDDWNNPGSSHTGAVIDLESVRGGTEGRGQADSGRSNQHGHGTDWALPGFRSS